MTRRLQILPRTPAPKEKDKTTIIDNYGVTANRPNFAITESAQFPAFEAENSTNTRLEPYNVGELKAQAKAAMLRASGISIDQSEIRDWFDENGDLRPSRRSRLEFVPYPVQIGIVTNIPKTETVLPGTDLEFSENASDSSRRTYGVLNNPDQHYDGPRSSFMVPAALASAAILFTASRGLTVIFSGLLGSAIAPIGGSSNRNSVNNRIARGLGFPETDFTIDECVSEGLPIVLGMDLRASNLFSNSAANLGTAALNAAASTVGLPGLGVNPDPIYESPGFYHSLSRNVVADLRSLVEDVGGLRNSSFGGSGQGGYVGKFRELVETLRRSPTINFLAICAQIGDVELKKKKGILLSMDTEPDRVPLPIDDLINVGNSTVKIRKMRDRQARSRLFLGRTKTGSRLISEQATSLRSVPGAFLPPNVVKNKKQLSSISNKIFPELKLPAQNNRIINSLKEALDFEYLPFYIQDMRTGEVAGFHAFLENISDNFSVNVSGEPTIGRMDDVQIYSKTTRTVGTSIRLVATSREDHDYLWWLVNWLTGLIYPQWSDGLIVDSENNRTSPFGRIPTASPLIRVRLGDVWKSNATDDNLKRLLTRDQNFIDGSFTDFGVSQIREINSNKFQGDWNLNDGSRYYIFPRPDGYSVREEPGNFKDRFSYLGFNQEKEEPLKIYLDKTEVIKFAGTENGKNYAEITTGEYRQKQIYFSVDDISPEVNDIPNAERALNNAALGIVGGLLGGSNFSRAIASRSENPDINFQNSPFVQSIRKNSIGGLAGMITNFEIDYNWIGKENFALEVEPGSIAPIGVKIGFTMNVIHDIQPGKDSQGRNRAPIYGVGSVYNTSSDE